MVNLYGRINTDTDELIDLIKLINDDTATQSDINRNDINPSGGKRGISLKQVFPIRHKHYTYVNG